MANSCKYYKQVLQVSYDSGVTWVNVGETRKGDLYDYESMQCGGGVTQYRWVDVTGQYTCDGTTKYQKTKKQYSNDGTTWQDVSPAEYGKGDVIEYQSEDCGYEPPSYSGEYLTFVAIDDGRFKFSGSTGNNVSNDYISYSMDEGSTWSTLASDTYSPTVYAGQKIMWKGNLTPTSSGIGRFTSTGRFNIEGNVMSLLYSDNFADKTDLTGKNYVFFNLFGGCTGLTSAENLVLPAMTLASLCYCCMFLNCTSLTTVPELPATTLSEQCYSNMFYGCTSLTTAPGLPATTLAFACYHYMFYGCTSLTTAPALPATTLSYKCYGSMFNGCTSLTTAPVLSAETLAQSCYAYMFNGCTSLNYIKCLATDISATDCTKNWVIGVASSGTFVKASSMNDWSTGVDGIPNNWTVQNA